MKQITEKSVRIIINTKNYKFKKFYVSKQLTLREALKELNLGYIIHNIESTFQIKKDTNLLNNFKFLSTLHGEKKINLDKKVDQDILIALIKTDDIKKYYFPLTKNIIVKTQKAKINFDTMITNKFKINISGILNSFEKKSVKRVHKIKLPPLGTIRCHYLEHFSNKTKKEITESNIEDYFDLKINGKKTLFRKNTFYTFQTTKKHNIELTLKHNLSKKLKLGFQNKKGKCKKANKNGKLYNFGLKNKNFTDILDINIKLTYFN